MRMAMGSSEVLPLAETCRTAMALGPLSFLAGMRRSPVGTIRGRLSWALAPTHIANASNAAVTKLRYKVCWKLRPLAAARAIGFECAGDIAMKVHDKAPEFTLQDENGKEFSLKELRGKTVILFFYPRANTPG